jgi:hypothetical protein
MESDRFDPCLYGHLAGRERLRRQLLPHDILGLLAQSYPYASVRSDVQAKVGWFCVRYRVAVPAPVGLCPPHSGREDAFALGSLDFEHRNGIPVRAFDAKHAA